MTTPIDPLAGVGLPYTFAIYAATKYWWYIEPKNRGTHTNSSFRHALPQGEYQIMATTASGETIRVTIGDAGKERIINLVDAGVKGETKTGTTTITITGTEGYAQFSPIGVLAQAALDDAAQAVITVFPFTTYTPE